jgi:hypothetical protein
MAEGRSTRAERTSQEPPWPMSGRRRWPPMRREPLVAVVQLDLDQITTGSCAGAAWKLLAAHPAHPYAHGLMGEVLSIVGRHDAAMAHNSVRRPESIRLAAPLDKLGDTLAFAGTGRQCNSNMREGLVVNPTSEELQMLLASVWQARVRSMKPLRPMTPCSG